MNERRDGIVCPNCGARAVPIAWGLPGPDLFEESARGEVAIGGCLVGDDDPDYSCESCERNIWADGRHRPWSEPRVF